MVKLDLLDANNIYRVTAPPVIMPETKGAQRKNQAYIVWAPTPEAGLSFISSTPLLRFRYLTKYYIPKKWTIKLFGQPNKIVRMNADGEYTELVNKYKTGNLKNLDGVTSFIPMEGRTNTLKNLNVYYEMNYIFDEVLNNPKDTRIYTKTINDLTVALKSSMGTLHAVGTYTPTIIIPMNLWLTHADYTNPTKMMRPLSKKPMGMILSLLRDPSVVKSFGRFVLIDGNVIAILDADAMDDSSGELISDTIMQFFARARKQKETQQTMTVANDELGSVEVIPVEGPVQEEEPVQEPEPEPTPEEQAKEAKAQTKMAEAEKATSTQVKAEKVLKSVKVDPDKAPPEVMDKAVKAVEKAEKKSARAAKATSTKTPAKAVPKAVDDDKDLSDIQDVKIPDEDLDAILASKMSGQSIQSEKRNQMLREKYKDLKMGETPIADLVEVESKTEIPKVEVKARTINPEMKEIKGQRFEEAYNENLMQSDLVSILMHFSTVKPAMYLNKDIKIVDVSTHTDRIIKYTVEFEDENRKRHRFSFLLPKMYKEKYLYLNGQELVITHQKLPFPITKIQADRCQLVTNYNKIFVYRYGQALSPRMTKLKKILSNDKLKGVSVRKGDCTQLNKARLTTIEFDELSSTFVKVSIGNTNTSVTFTFDPADTVAIYDFRKMPQIEGDTPDTIIPLAYRKNGKSVTQYWLSGTTNHVYSDDGADHGELSDFLITTLIEFNPAMEKEVADTTVGTRFIYSRVRIMNEDIPLILVMGASDPGGLIGALEKGKVNYQFVDKRPAVDKNVTGVIPFADGYLVFDRYPYENSLLMNGLNTFPTKEYNFYDMGTRDTYVEIFDTLYGKRTLADNMVSFYYMMVDPITKDVLHRLDMPTDYISLLYFCNGTLADNSYQIDSNYENSRIRSNEIIMAHLYRELAVAWSNYRSGRTDTFSIPENAVIKILLTSKIVDPKSKLNITLELENDRNVKLKGPSGMNEDHSFTLEKRAYHPSMRGVISTTSVPSGEVGINRHMVINPNIDDARGFITVNKDEEYDGTELVSPGEALSPFSAESADIERFCMSISQAKHLVPVASQCSTPISYDFERVAPYLSNDFAFQAKKDGKVVEISNDLIIVQYSDGSYDDIDLSTHPARNTDGGFYIMNNMISRYKVGQKFKSGDILAYDPKCVNELDFFGDPTVNVGTLARVALESNGNVYEDSGYITDDFAHRFATRITRQKRIILSPFANIKYMAKIGQAVQANDIILAFDDTEDEFSSQLLASIADQAGDDDVITATSAPIITKYTGVVRDINITYTVPIERMTPSLQKIVQNYAKDASKREKVLGKYRNISDANTIVKSSEMAVTDASGKVGGVKVDEGIIIDFYIEYEDVAGNGDKGSIGALKFTVCNVIPTELAGYTDFDPDRKIDVYVASFGAFKRMVADVEKIGILTKVLVEKKRLMKEKYGARIKNELKKK